MPRHYKDWLQAYALFTRNSEAPPIAHFYVGCSMVAGALQRYVWMENYTFQWTPNLYIILVGPAGIIGKSTTIRLGLDLLREVPNVVFGPQSSTWQYLASALESSQTSFKWPDHKGEEVDHYMAPITCAPSELGTFLRMDDPQFVSLLTDLYDSAKVEWVHGTKTTGTTEIINPWINFIGATTPSWLATNYPVKSLDDGLTSRIIFVYGDRKEKFIAYPGDHWDPGDHAQMRQELIEDLTEISNMRGEFSLSREAKEWGTQWYEDFWTRSPIHLQSARFGGYRARKQAHMHKLAMILSASESDSRVIELHHLHTASNMLTRAEQDMLTVFESLGVVEETRYVREIMAFVKAYQIIPGELLYKLTMNTIPDKSFKPALVAAAKGGYIKQVIHDGKIAYTWLNAPPSVTLPAEN